MGPAGVATAEVSDDCSAWTFLPDFRCEDRTARPADAFNPVGMPFLFEDPYITSDLDFAYVYHRLPNSGALGVAFDGGGAHVLALQIRLALTDRLALIATKDGLTMMRPGDNSVIAEATGFYDLTVGFKYALIDMREHNFILTPAIRYEIPIGQEKLFQGYGPGVIIPSASFRWGLGEFGLEGANIVGSLGGQVPINGDKNVNSMFYNVHLDYGIELGDGDGIVRYIVPFLELNGIHYTRNGAGTNQLHLRGGGTVSLNAAQLALGTGPFEGFDIANLGSQGISGANVLVMGGGIQIPMQWGLSLSAMYEGPVTSRKDVHHQRFTFLARWEM